MTREATDWIERLGLVQHPEGGCYRETYRAESRVSGGRCHSTAIYYLLRSGEVSRLHRLRSDELFHFYRGSPLVVHVIHEDGRYEPLTLGADPDRGETLQAVVRAGCWFGATVEGEETFALVGCTVSPGFEFADLEMADRAGLVQRWPQHRKLIERLT
jgi:predicted cupin superfamily sugar epimerase